MSPVEVKCLKVFSIGSEIHEQETLDMKKMQTSERERLMILSIL